MIVSISWLKEYVPITTAPAALADALTMAGLEVEAIYDRFDFLDSVLVGRIVECAPHPQAPQMKLCRVETGGQVHRVVCGAPNAAASQLAPLALPETCLPDGRILRRQVIRGEVSEGMLCSAAELGLGNDASGIMLLDSTLLVGQRLNQALALEDTVFEIGLTPNRPDCLSIIGVAREVAAIQKVALTLPQATMPPEAGAIDQLSSVTIEAPEHCPRYAARLIEGIRIASSPFWLQDRLLSVGLRPINNIVDVTNFVMMETGQPLHAFDFKRLAEHRILVRCAREGEKFKTLDGKERQLGTEMLMICDGRKPVAIGGVMGGLNSEIHDDTTRVLIESAYFNPVSIRKTAKQLGLATDASHRFERGVDPHGTLKALNRAAQLMVAVGGGQLVGGIIDAHPRPVPRKILRLGTAATNRHLGTAFDRQTIAEALGALAFKVETSNSEQMTVHVPSFRVDVERPEDLMEEVARLCGYQHIPTTFPAIATGTAARPAVAALRDRLRTLLTGLGFTEAINYSFVSKLARDYLGLKQGDPRRNQLPLLNPLSEEQTVMRTSLVPGLLACAQHNIAQQQRNLQLFEIGKVFIAKGQEQLPQEIEMLAGFWTGARQAPSWLTGEDHCDFYDIKGAVETLLGRLKIPTATFRRLPTEECSYTQPGHSARIAINGTSIGLVGAVHPRVSDLFSLKQPAFLFELDTGRLRTFVQEKIQAAPLPKYPATHRDVTLIVDKQCEAMDIIDWVAKADEKLVESLQIFDVYQGEPIPKGQKSLSFRIVYRSEAETLADEAVNQLHQKMIQKLVKAFGASLPA